MKIYTHLVVKLTIVYFQVVYTHTSDDDYKLACFMYTCQEEAGVHCPVLRTTCTTDVLWKLTISRDGTHSGIELSNPWRLIML